MASRFGWRLLSLVAVLSDGRRDRRSPHGRTGRRRPRSVTVAVRNISPFAMTNGTGRTGFTVELWEEIAKRQGWTTNYVEAQNVGEQLKDVEDGRAEVGAGAISITAERRERFDFSQPIFNAGLQIMVLHRSIAPSPPRLVNFLPLLFSKAMLAWLIAGFDPFGDSRPHLLARRTPAARRTRRRRGHLSNRTLLLSRHFPVVRVVVGIPGLHAGHVPPPGTRPADRDSVGIRSHPLRLISPRR